MDGTRRGFFRAIAGAAALPFIKQGGGPEPIKGVGVLHAPDHAMADPEAMKAIQECMSNIRSGTVLCFSSDRDECGNYVWDFKIVGGDPAKVKLERQA